MNSRANVFIRIALALLFCVGMFVTANSAALGQRDRHDRGRRARCERDCEERYRERKRDCNNRRGRDKNQCKRDADRDRRDCRENCRH
jgi:hypothetical protein